MKTTNHPSNLTIIVAVSENDVIGKDNDLIWHLKNDLKRFKALTSGHCIIMGRKTFESFPKPLPNRTHIVITRQENYKAPEGVIVVNSLEAAIEAGKARCKSIYYWRWRNLQTGLKCGGHHRIHQSTPQL